MAVVAIAAEGDLVASHFGRCRDYVLVETENGEVVRQWTVDNPGHEPGRLPRFLKQLGASCVITGGMGPRAVSMFENMDIQVIVGYVGKVDKAIELYRTHKLTPATNRCEHDEVGQDGGDC